MVLWEIIVAVLVIGGITFGGIYLTNRTTTKIAKKTIKKIREGTIKSIEDMTRSR